MSNRLTQALDHDLTGQALGAALRHMEIAEEEITRAQQQHPDKAKVLRHSFLACPTPMIPSLPHLDPLFRTHVRQLLAMIAEGQDVDRPTLAEVSVMTLAVAEKAPPITELVLLVASDHDTAAAYGLEPVPAPPHVGDHLWPELRQACRQVFVSTYGKARSQILAEALRANQIMRKQKGSRS